MNASANSRNLKAADVLRRYKDEQLPAFCGIDLTDVNQVGNFGEPPLHVAASRGILEEIAALIAAGADVNAPGELGNTPLHEAVSQNHIAGIEFLLNHGATVTAKNEFGSTAFDVSKTNAARTLLKEYSSKSSREHSKR